MFFFGLHFGHLLRLLIDEDQLSLSCHLFFLKKKKKKKKKKLKREVERNDPNTNTSSFGRKQD